MDTSEQYKKMKPHYDEPLETIEVVKWYEDPVYIKMCDCEEIQNIVIERVKKDNGWLRTSAVGLLVNAIAKDGEVFTFHLDTWLPRQDQLQEMVETKLEPIYVLSRFTTWIVTTFGNGIWIERWKALEKLSREQLWLAFVMKEKYNKVWNGESFKEE